MKMSENTIYSCKYANFILIYELQVGNLQLANHEVKIRKEQAVDRRIPIIIMNHGLLGRELIASAEMIVGKIDEIQSISLMPGMPIEEYCILAEKVISGMKGPIIILTDLYGGTTCNVAMMLRQKFELRVLCGMNLPMLLELSGLRETQADVDRLVEEILKTGREGILTSPAVGEAEESDEEEGSEEIWQR